MNRIKKTVLIYLFAISFTNSCIYKKYSIRINLPENITFYYLVKEETYIINPFKEDTLTFKNKMNLYIHSRYFEKQDFTYLLDFNIKNIEMETNRKVKLPASVYLQIKIDTLGEVKDVKLDRWTEEILNMLALEKKQIFSHIFNLPPKSPLKKGEKIIVAKRETLMNIEWKIKKEYKFEGIKNDFLHYKYSFYMEALNKQKTMKGILEGEVSLDKTYHFIKKEKSYFEIFLNNKKIFWKKREINLSKIESPQ